MQQCSAVSVMATSSCWDTSRTYDDDMPVESGEELQPSGERTAQ